MVDFTGGVKTSGDAICLMLKPLAGGPAKQFYPAELAQSVEWIFMGCLSNKSFSDASDTPPPWRAPRGSVVMGRLTLSKQVIVIITAVTLTL